MVKSERLKSCILIGFPGSGAKRSVRRLVTSKKKKKKKLNMFLLKPANLIGEFLKFKESQDWEMDKTYHRLEL